MTATADQSSGLNARDHNKGRAAIDGDVREREAHGGPLHWQKEHRCPECIAEREAAERVAADHAPAAADSDRVEQIDKVLRVHAYRIVRESPRDSTIFGCWGCDWQGDSSSIPAHQAAMLAVTVIGPILALLAEQAATIERLTADARQTDWPTAARSILALGSQQTEGQG